MKKSLLVLCSLFVLALLPVQSIAQTAGSACATAGQFHESGSESLVCDSSIWKPVISFNPNGKTSFQVGNDTGACTIVKTGRLRYSSATWEYCNGTTWLGMTINSSSECNVFGQSVGYVCPDGSQFIGFSQDASGAQPLFATRCDGGQTWNGAACVGTRVGLAWGSSGTARGAYNIINGKAQSAMLGALGAAAHPAASYCENLVMHGKSDWYLPAVAEGLLIVFNQGVISGYSTAAHSITSTESDADTTTAFSLNPTAQGGTHNNAKTYAGFTLRCIRRD